MTADPVYVTDYITGVDILVAEGDTPFFGTGAGASTLTGGTAEAWARHKKTGVRFPCPSCSITGAKEVRATFGVRGLPDGPYSVEVYAAPLGYALKRIAALDVRVEPAAGT